MLLLLNGYFSNLSPDFLPNGRKSVSSNGTEAQVEPILLDKTENPGEAVREEEVFLYRCRGWLIEELNGHETD